MEIIKIAEEKKEYNTNLLHIKKPITKKHSLAQSHNENDVLKAIKQEINYKEEFFQLDRNSESKIRRNFKRTSGFNIQIIKTPLQKIEKDSVVIITNFI